MPYGTATQAQSEGEVISHCTGVRMRITGEGQLEMTLYSLDNERSQELVPFQMSQNTRIEPFRLANMLEQRFSIYGTTDTISEHFRIKRIILYLKPVYTDYPGGMNAIPTS